MNNYTAGLYFVQRILARKRNQDGSFSYKIKWMDYPFSQSTWEPLPNLIHAQPLVDAFNIEMDIKKQKLKQIRREQYLQRKLKRQEADKVQEEEHNKIIHQKRQQQKLLTSQKVDKNAEISQQINTIQRKPLTKKKRGRPILKKFGSINIDFDANKYSSSIRVNTDMIDGVNLIQQNLSKKERNEIQQIAIQQQNQKINSIILNNQQKKHNQKQLKIFDKLLQQYDALKARPIFNNEQRQKHKNILQNEENKASLTQDIMNKSKKGRRRLNKFHLIQKIKKKRGRKPKNYVKYLNDQNLLKIQKFKVKVAKFDTNNLDSNVFGFSFGRNNIETYENIQKTFHFIDNDDQNHNIDQQFPVDPHQYSSQPNQLNLNFSHFPQQPRQSRFQQQKYNYFLKVIQQQIKIDENIKPIQQNVKRIEQNALTQQKKKNEQFVRLQSQQEQKHSLIQQKQQKLIKPGFIKIKMNDISQEQEDAQLISKHAQNVMNQIIQRNYLGQSSDKKILQQYNTQHNLNNTQSKQQKWQYDQQQYQDDNNPSNIQTENIIKPLIKIKTIRKKRSFAEIFLKNTFSGKTTAIISGPRHKQKNYKKYQNFQTFYFKLQPSQPQNQQEIMQVVQPQKLPPIDLQHQLKHFDQRRQYFMNLDPNNRLQVEIKNENDEICSIQTKQIFKNCPKWLKMYYQSFI